MRQKKEARKEEKTRNLPEQMENLALCVLYNQEKKILIQHRSLKAERYPGMWGFFGGKIEPGEAPEQAVVRGAKENLGYTLRRPQLSKKHEFWDEYSTGIQYVFIAHYDAQQEFHLQEGESFMWVDKDLTQFLPMTDHNRELLQDITRLIEKKEKQM